MSEEHSQTVEAEPIKRPPGRPPKEQPKSELEFVADNIAAVHQYYRSARTPGTELGINVTIEAVFDLLHQAFTLGLQRKLWSAPK